MPSWVGLPRFNRLQPPVQLLLPSCIHPQLHLFRVACCRLLACDGCGADCVLHQSAPAARSHPSMAACAEHCHAARHPGCLRGGGVCCHTRLEHVWILQRRWLTCPHSQPALLSVRQLRHMQRRGGSKKKFQAIEQLHLSHMPAAGCLTCNFLSVLLSTCNNQSKRPTEEGRVGAEHMVGAERNSHRKHQCRLAVPAAATSLQLSRRVALQCD